MRFEAYEKRVTEVSSPLPFLYVSLFALLDYVRINYAYLRSLDFREHHID
jgi:hypothetical protein